MRLTGRLASGADEWSCPTCGRRIALRRPPDPELVVLETGDESAVHVGLIEPDEAEAAAAAAAEKYGLGPIQEIPRPPGSGAPQAAQPGAAQPGVATPDAEDRAWLAEIGIDWDGGAAA
ncbi:hypothetical protein ACFC1R_00255 [Kitasatospora sp. NPDC056138]|uniref:hypothetical protein n=1 Tax=Kitasatospora sp. NPDC056138 TaxID=3345724 RepID=UPI0035E0FE79